MSVTSANPFLQFDFTTLKRALSAAGASPLAIDSSLVSSKELLAAYLQATIPADNIPQACQELLDCQVESKEPVAPSRLPALAASAARLNAAVGVNLASSASSTLGVQQHAPFTFSTSSSTTGLSNLSTTSLSPSTTPLSLSTTPLTTTTPFGLNGGNLPSTEADLIAKLATALRSIIKPDTTPSSVPMQIDSSAAPTTAQNLGTPSSFASPAQALALARQSACQGTSAFAPTIPEAFLPAALPNTLATKLDKGEYVDFDEAFRLLSPNPFQPADSSEMKADEAKRPKQLTMLREWLVVFASILLYTADHKPSSLRDGVAYLKAFVLLATRNGFPAAYDYDRSNRAYCARSGNHLSIFKPDLWLPPVSVPQPSNPGSNQPPRKRQREPSFDKPQSKRQRQARFADGKEICWLFNIGRCNNPCSRNRAHLCWICSKDHAQTACTASSAAPSATSSPAKGKT